MFELDFMAEPDSVCRFIGKYITAENSDKKSYTNCVFMLCCVEFNWIELSEKCPSSMHLWYARVQIVRACFILCTRYSMFDNIEAL